MTFGAPPRGASDALKAQFETTDKLFTRLFVEVVSNPNFRDTATCNRKQVGETYTQEWLPYARAWKEDFWSVEGEEMLNQLTGRANGWAAGCFPDHKHVKGTDVEDEHKAAAWVDINAPGGAPPRPGTGILGFKKSTLLLGGLALLGAAGAARLLFR